ncbi:MAG: hypothetical protein ACOH5I_21735 [Oligoflexus sp.]
MIERQSCVVKALENPHLNGILLGLEITNHCLSLRQEMFPCCSGRGFFESKSLSMNADSCIRCNLKERMRMAEDILRQFYRSWGTQFHAPHQLSTNHSAKILRHVSEALKGIRPQATILQGKKGQPSEIWPMALACSWRFGIPTHIVRPQKNQSNILPPAEKTRSTFAIFIEQADRLWEEQNAETVRLLVNFAYNSNALIWLEFCPDQEPAQADPRDISVAAHLQQRLHKAKSKSPMELLGTKCAARLQSLCSLPRSNFDEEVEL